MRMVCTICPEWLRNLGAANLAIPLTAQRISLWIAGNTFVDAVEPTRSTTIGSTVWHIGILFVR